jgi:hypothetical protein
VNARKILGACLGLIFFALAMLAPYAHAEYGINTLEAKAINRDGSIDRQAGSHPYEYIVHFGVNLNSEGAPEGKLGHVEVDLPRGLIGNPQALPTCSGADFEGTQASCPGSTQVGVFEANTSSGFVNVPIYNVAPPQGVAGAVGLSVFGISTLQEASLRPLDYGISVADVNVPTNIEVKTVTERIWGEPSDPSHDPERVCRTQDGKLTEGNCSTEAASRPFFTLPTSCSGPLTTTVTIYSIAEPSVPRSETAQSLDSGGNPGGMIGCAKPQFNPGLKVQPETAGAESPTGLHVDVSVPQNEELGQLGAANLKGVSLALPTGMTVNPSSANGLAACSESQIGIGTNEPAACPEASKLGTVTVRTPLLDHPVNGAVYLARQLENPFHSLIALYVALEDPVRGVVVKVAGKVTPNLETGQLTAVFDENPQVPFEHLEVDFAGGARAALTTPPVCGTYKTESLLTPWTAPEGLAVSPSDSFSTTNGAIGGPCPVSESQMPNTPSFEAGTISPLAGSYSTFVVKMSRENGSQQIRSLSVTLPPGLTGKLAGLNECSDVQIEAAEKRTNPGEGALEAASPSCPQTSEIGAVNVGAGSGAPLFVQGHAYLAGPYKGAPLSMVIITPAVAGPFDLGVVAVRAALYVNESTAQITVKSDRIPSILQGIPLDVRSIAVQVNRNQFTLNPTSCEAMSIGGEAISPLGDSLLSQRFQVGGCKALQFKPTLKLSFRGQTKRTGNPAVKAVVMQPKGENADIAGITTLLPKGMLIDNSHISNPCTRVQFNSGSLPGEGCPAKSILGTAKVWTPLLEQPEEGKVYFRSNGGERQLPDMVVALRGKVPIQAVGFIDSVGKKGAEVRRVRARFLSLPDVPVSRIEVNLAGGKKGLLENSKNLCKGKDLAKFQLSGHNGKLYDTEPKVQVSCGGGKSKGGKAGKKQ